MQTVNPRAAFLSNYEVLTFLKQQQSSRAAQIKALSDSLTENNGKRPPEHDESDRIQPQDLHTVTFECVKYLEDNVHPIRRQTGDSITTLIQELSKWELTKAEKLQIVNLAPTTLVALYVCVDDFEDRFPNPSQPLEILDLVKKHLGEEMVAATAIGSLRPKRDAMEEDEPDDGAQEDEEENDFVQEGLGGAGEAGVRDIDEEVES